MNAYIIRVNTIDNLYADYLVEADNLIIANNKAKEAFFKSYPDSEPNIKLSLQNIEGKKIREIIEIIEGGNLI